MHHCFTAGEEQDEDEEDEEDEVEEGRISRRKARFIGRSKDGWQQVIFVSWPWSKRAIEPVEQPSSSCTGTAVAVERSAPWKPASRSHTRGLFLEADEEARRDEDEKKETKKETKMLIHPISIPFDLVHRPPPTTTDHRPSHRQPTSPKRHDLDS
ncbi:hypothetical protein MGYG_06905 [Nannizzia gypsea CBS 118893]|uniref:Uncharacterized protein n=1 Tax=Arthroderma gypseum (strain ATCC MYA-4604 / CBS 118893) TaxID=535722 RepID=E4V1J1_ARTGP|nr:hypothetical protein MGYG_06905 [Nannizzia gypsea CBS 118893]EFR03906.1 hypothetical protein MGYG_06905 [Nannizzia gypsea CBS 118893]